MNSSLNPAVILVHRNKGKDADEVFKGIVERLYKPDLRVSYDRVKRRIDIADSITFLVRNGDTSSFIGMRYDLYNTDSYILYDRIMHRCMNGKKGEIRDIYEFVDRIMDGYSEQGDSYWD